MHKKLEADLMSLAHSILKMKNKEDVFALKDKSQVIYEKLSLLAFVEEYVNTTPNLEETKEELLSIVEVALATKNSEVEEVVTSDSIIPQLDAAYLELENEKLEAEIGDGFNAENVEIVEKIAEFQGPLEVVKEDEIEQPFDELEEILASEADVKQETLNPEKEAIEEEVEELISFEDLKEISENNDAAINFKNDVKDVAERKTTTLEEELQDTIPVDIMANLFEPIQPKSLNDKLFGNIQIGLNDRIVFVKNLFNGSQEDFNRVISQLNTSKTEKEAKKFITKMVKPDYNWTEHEELEIRFMEIIERKFA